jgi:hypothetical protein
MCRRTTISYHDNLMGTEIQDDLALLSTGLTAVTGIPGTCGDVANDPGAKYLVEHPSVRISAAVRGPQHR